MTGTEQVLIEDWCQQYPSHSLGSLVFGADGALYASAGDGASFTYTDYGQGGGTLPNTTSPVNPCGDPPGSPGSVLSPPTAEGGALRAQDIRTTGDPTGLNGSILRLDPVTGAGLPDNPGAASSSANVRRIIAHGLRNPFRFTIRPGTNELWIGDVGYNKWEELDRIVNPSDATVENFGWPCYEGVGREASYDAANVNLCETLYTQGGVTAPYFTYDHNVAVGTGCRTGSSSVSGAAFYPTTGGTFPSAYAGALFFADYSRDCIWSMRAGTNGLPDPATVATFVTDAINPVDLKVGPGGDLYYADFDGGTIRRLSFGAPANLPPVAAIAANPGSGPAPLAVNFTAAGSSDPEGGALTYAWDLDNDGAFDDGTGLTRSFTYPTPGSITVTVRATDPAGLTDTESTVVTVTGAGQTTRYLSDLATSGTPLNGWGPFERDRSNGEQGAADGLPLTLAGVTYAKGLGIHAASDLRFPIGGGCTAFSAKIGIDDEVGNQGGVVFEASADGTRIHQSAQLGGASATVSLDLPIATTTQELRLVVTIGNNTANYDHADWADAKIVCGGTSSDTTPPTITARTPTPAPASPSTSRRRPPSRRP